jgi:hypothetical protein
LYTKSRKQQAIWTQSQFPPDDKTGALPIHFPSSSSFSSQTARLFLESKSPSSPLPMIVAVVGLAAPFVKMGTLGLGSATYRHPHHALVNTPEQSPADLVDRLSAGKFASGVDLPICVWLESVNEADKEPPDPASAVANVLVAAGVEDQ